MQIIPAINCENFECVKEKLEKAAGFSDWAQIDIADGKFTSHKTWNNPSELTVSVKSGSASGGNSYKLKVNLEVHLMVENPEKVVDDWIKTGAKRIILHLEALNSTSYILNSDIEFGIAINPETLVEKLAPFIRENLRDNLRKLALVQILAVNPGLAGQKFQNGILDKIRFLKKNYPDVIIEVDGGINLETAKLCKEAGADILVSSSYIWGSENPERAYKELSSI